MTRIGLNVPPGFVITTEACLAYLDDPEHKLPPGLIEMVLPTGRRRSTKHLQGDSAAALVADTGWGEQGGVSAARRNKSRIQTLRQGTPIFTVPTHTEQWAPSTLQEEVEA
jgi:phosphoenolpyruvate synthase/pyruvate phosphate dikinase